MSDNVTVTTIQTINPLFPIIIPIVSSLVFLFIGFFLNSWNSKNIEEKRSRDDAMRNHFQSLRRAVISPVITQLGDIKSYLGELSPGGQGRRWSPNDVDFTLTVPNEDFNIFSLHFYQQSLQIQELLKKMNEHNAEFDHYVQTLRERLNFIFPLSQKVSDSPFLYSELLSILRQNIFELIKITEKGINYKPINNFNEALIKKENGYWFLLSKSESVRYARLNAIQEADICKGKLIELQNSDELQKLALKLSKQSDSIERDFTQTVKVLEFLRENYTSLRNIMDKNRECQYCQAIKD
jgi:hypothetical protein